MELRFEYHPAIIETIKPIPGAQWYRSKRCWEYPAEMLHLVGLEEQHVLKREVNPHPDLYEYQKIDVQNALAFGRYMLAYEMGLGKTGVAIDCCRQLDAERILYVCPAIVRQHVADEFDKWWPGRPTIDTITTGADVENCKFELTICSYNLLQKLPQVNWEVIIIDEAHYIKNAKTRRSIAIKKILEKSPRAFQLALTGTPVTNRPVDLFNILNTLWPKRFGSYYKFTRRYCEVVEDPFAHSGTKVAGLDEEHAEELRHRIRAISSRVTKKDVAHLLPPVLISNLRFKPTQDRRMFVVDHIVNFLETVNKVFILTHHKSMVSAIADALALEKINVTTIDGDLTPDERYAKISEARSENGVVVATMHSVTTGINLTDWSTVIFAELYWSPAVMMQTMGRFHRLSGGDPVSIYFAICDGTRDEVLSDALRKKVLDISSIVGEGAAEQQITDAFEMSPEEESSFLAGLSAVADTAND